MEGARFYCRRQAKFRNSARRSSIERTKIAKELSETTENMQKFKEKADQAKAAEGEIISLKNQLRDKQAKSRKLDEDKALVEASLKACEQEVAE